MSSQQFPSWFYRRRGLDRLACGCALTVLCVVLAGCSHAPAHVAASGQIPDAFRPQDDAGKPLAFGTEKGPNGLPAQYVDGSPTYLIDGTPIDYRPRNMQLQILALKYVFIRDIGQPWIGIEGTPEHPALVYLTVTDGDQVLLTRKDITPQFDATGGGVCWRVFICENPDCPGRSGKAAPMFAPCVPGVVGHRDGTLKWPPVWRDPNDPNPPVSPLKLINCPHCRQRDWLQHYVPPDTAAREVELQAELDRLKTH